MSAPRAAVLVVTFVFFARGWIGGGDAKLAAATALWLGFDQLLELPDLSPRCFGGVLTLAIMRFRADAAAGGCSPSQEWAKRLHRMDAGVPYGIALALAALLIYPDTPWMKSLGMYRLAAVTCVRAALAAPARIDACAQNRRARIG